MHPQNSCAAILLDSDGAITAVTEQVKSLLLAHFVVGSDPGLCVATAVPQAITDFGCKAQQELVTQAEARTLAAAHNLTLLGWAATRMA